MKFIILSLFVAISGLAFTQEFIEPLTGKSMDPHSIAECQNDYRYYTTYSYQFSQENMALKELDLKLQKQVPGSMEYCYYLKNYNLKAHELKK